MRRSILWLTTLSGLCFAVLLGRLFVWMGFPNHIERAVTARWTDTVAARADLQRLLLLETDDGRGRILFRNGAPWSGSWYRTQFGPTEDGVEVGVHHETSDPALGATMIGQVGLPEHWPDDHRAIQEEGRSGLEYTFDRVLAGSRPGYVGVLRDVKGEAQPGMVYRIAPVPGVNIRTSIDYAWQRWAESALAGAHVTSGAVVILNVADNQVLAMASRDDRYAGQNVALQAETPGSVFKLVTTAAALDSYRYRIDSSFYCSGRVHIPGVRMNCWAKHGSETLLDALAQSCDVAFANIGWQVGRVGFEEMARRLHIGETNLQSIDGQSVVPGAQKGVLFTHPGDDAGLLANTAIGQQDVRLTPLQAANLASTVARGGVYRDARLALTAERGKRVVRAYTTGSSSPGMSSATAQQIAAAMRQAVTSGAGTGHVLAHAAVPCAVKTGTAELNPRSIVNGWLVGFAPYNHPQVAFCVFAGHTSSVHAHQAVQEITKELLIQYRQFQSASVIS